MKEQEKDIRLATQEILSLLKTVDKLKLKNTKTYDKRRCRNCKKDYTESENYNWSCRLHKSEYGGVMWWCCGRKNKDHPGCKFASHVNQEEQDEYKIYAQLNFSSMNN